MLKPHGGTGTGRAILLSLSPRAYSLSREAPLFTGDRTPWRSEGDPNSRFCTRRRCCECRPERIGSCGFNRSETQRQQATQVRSARRTR